MVAKFVSYRRVSTARQGQSGLGLEAQETAVGAMVRSAGGRLMGDFVEIESGKRSDRPELAKAIAHAKSAKATLVVAKLDRLARNVAFLSALMESGIEFVACDNPHANRLTLHILAAVAEDEARRISERTKAALAAARARGAKLGSARPGHWDGREDRRIEALARAREAAAEQKREQASQPHYLADQINQQRAAGASFEQIAERLNADGHTTPRGALWSATAVWRIWQRSNAAG